MGKYDKFDMDVGVRIVERARQLTTHTIVKNAGGEGAVVTGELMKRNDPSIGFDAQNDEYVNMVESGIIDPVKVVRTSFMDATRIASLMITTEAMIVDLPEDKPPAAPDMGGMG